MKQAHKHKDIDGNGLPPRLVEVLHAGWPALTPAQLQQGWQQLSTTRQPHKRPFYLSFALAAATAGVAALLYVKSVGLTYEVQGGTWRDQKLAVSADQHARIAFSDGTHVEAHPRSETELLATNRAGARLRLHRGAVALQVKRLTGARWSVAAGPFTVAVKGTTFDMKWEDQTLTVFLQEGRVDVTGPLLDGLVVLRPGQRLVANLATRETRIFDGGNDVAVSQRIAPPTVEQPAQALPPLAVAEPLARTPHPAAHPKRAKAQAPAGAKTDWSQQMGSGGFAEIVAQARDFGIDEAVARKPLSEVAALADAARYQRQNDIAKVALLALRRRFHNAGAAKDAAFHLGRLFDGEVKVAEALRWYDAYLNESPQGTFLCECVGRKMSLLVRQGQAAAARSAASQYLARCPSGPFAKMARALEEE